MSSQSRPQSQWLRSFILFSLLALLFLAALGLSGVYVARRIMHRGGAGAAPAQPADIRPSVPLPAETVGWDNVIANLLSAFDSVDVVALGETHESKVDSDLRLRLVRDPDFPFRVRFIVVEFGNSLYQETLDKYVYGDDVPMAAVENVWRNTTRVAGADSPVYAEFFAAVREVNRKLPPARRLRVIAGDPPIDWDSVHAKKDFDPFFLLRGFPVSMERVAVRRGEKALVIYDAGIVKRPAFPLEAAADEAEIAERAEAPLPSDAPEMFKALQIAGPGRAFVVRTLTGINPLQATLKSSDLPVLVPLTGLHATLDSGLAASADACIYFGDTADAKATIGADPAIYRGTPYGEEVARRQRVVGTLAK